MAKMNEDAIIETISETGEKIKFELFDIIEFEDKEYALLTPVDGNDDEDLVLMRLLEEEEEYVFESIEDDDEFNRVSEYIECLAEDDDDE